MNSNHFQHCIASRLQFLEECFFANRGTRTMYCSSIHRFTNDIDDDDDDDDGDDDDTGGDGPSEDCVGDDGIDDDGPSDSCSDG